MSSHLIFLGTYTRHGSSQGIYALRLDRSTGALGAPELAAAATDPSWLARSPDGRLLFAIHASPAQAAAFAVGSPDGRLTPLPPGPDAAGSASPPSHLAVDATGRTLLAANYRDGFVASLPIRADGTLGSPRPVRHAGRGPHPSRQDRPHPHSVTVSPDNRYVLVADLGLDRIFSYALDPATATLAATRPAPVATAPAAGPRHAAFGSDGRHLYVSHELDNTVGVYDYEAATGALTPRQTLPTLPRGFAGENLTAEVRVHPSGRFVYVSNRGHDSIAGFAVDPVSGELSPAGITPSGGRTPRNFALSPGGDWLVCGHQDTPLVTVFGVDPATGRLSATGHQAEVPSVVCVLFQD